MRHDDVDQLRRHLVDVQRSADLAHSTVDHRVPHHRRIEETLLYRRRDPNDHLRRQLGVGGPDRLDRHDRIGDGAVRGPEGQHRCALPIRHRAVDKALQRGRGRPVRHGEEAGQLRTDERAGLGRQDVTGTAIVLPDPAGLVDAEQQRPGRGVGQYC